MKHLMLSLLLGCVLAGCKTQGPSNMFVTREALPYCEITQDKCGAASPAGMCCKESASCTTPPGNMKGPAILISVAPAGERYIACTWAYQ